MGEERAPAIWHLTRWLPRPWRLALLKALAWPEFEVSRLWLIMSQEGRPTVEFISPEESSAREHAVMGEMASYPPSTPQHPHVTFSHPSANPQNAFGIGLSGDPLWDGGNAICNPLTTNLSHSPLTRSGR